MITKSDIENLVKLLDRVMFPEEAWASYTKVAKMVLAESILESTVTELQDKFSCSLSTGKENRQ